MGPHPDGDPSGSLLKDVGSPMPNTQSQPIIGYTLMAAQQSCGLYGSSPWWRSLGEFLKDRGSPHAGCSELTYTEIYLDGCLSSLADYTGLHHDGDSLGSLLKDGGLLMHDVRSQVIIGYTSMAVQAVS